MIHANSLWAFAFPRIKKGSFLLFSSFLSALLLQNSSAEKRLIFVSCAVLVGVWKVIPYSQVAEQKAAREERGREEGEKDEKKRAEDTTRAKRR